MKRITILLTLVFFIISCQTQKADSSLQWKDFDFSEAGIKIALPCEPSKSIKTFQKEPKLAQVYQYVCEKDEFKFSVSLSEHFEEFDPKKVKDSIDSIEKGLRDGIKNNANFSSRDVIFQNFQCRVFDVKNATVLGRHLHIQNERGAYNIQLISNIKPNQSNEDFNSEFESVGKILFDSLIISEQQQ